MAYCLKISLAPSCVGFDRVALFRVFFCWRDTVAVEECSIPTESNRGLVSAR